MRTFLALLLLFPAAAVSFGQATIDFTQAGVEGGIPYYPTAITITDAPYSADNTGVIDCYSATTNALAHVTNGGALYFPAGRYYWSQAVSLSHTQQVEIRGAGMGLTWIDCGSTTSSPRGGINFLSLTTQNTTSISSGYTAGSYTLVVSSATGMVSNYLAQIIEENDPSKVFGTLSTATNAWHRQMSLITNVSGTTIMLNRPIYQNFSNSYTPVLRAFSKSINKSGVRGLTIHMTNGTPFHGIYFYIANNCWATNVAVTNAQYSNIHVNQSARVSVVGCTTRNHSTYDSTSRYGVQVSDYSTDCLIEDNILQGNNLCICVQGGASGNVIAYNFADEGFGTGFPTNTGMKGYLTFHGDFSHHNLVEGNVVPAYSSDAFWGCNTTNIAHRNWFTRLSKYNTTGSLSPQGDIGVQIEATNYNMQVTGSIIGHPRDSLITNSVWYVGFDVRQGNEPPAAPKDTTTTNTLTKTGNYDFSTNGTFWATGSPVTLTNSYYLTSKPGWFGNLLWPAVRPDLDTITSSITNSGIIPAQRRWLNQPYEDIGTTQAATVGAGASATSSGSSRR